MQKLFYLLVFFGLSLNLSAQLDSSHLLDFDLNRLAINRNGMTVLGTWAALNIGWSLTQVQHSNPKTQAYHQMNAAWNLVNLGIAGFAWYQAGIEPGIGSLSTSLEAQYSIEKILAVNTALDFAYILGGLYLQEYANRQDNVARYQGFGQAVIVNGGFLLVFDLSMYLIHRYHFNTELKPLLEAVSIGPNGIGLNWTF